MDENEEMKGNEENERRTTEVRLEAVADSDLLCTDEHMSGSAEHGSDLDISELVSNLKADYENREQQLIQKFQHEISERDNIIRQMIIQPAETKSKDMGDAIVDSINDKRKYKKW